MLNPSIFQSILLPATSGLRMFTSALFFYCSGDHRDLHSFPTRRSSDLRQTCCGSGQWHSSITHGSGGDRKSTRLNSSHLGISYAVFCLKKKIDMHHFRQSLALPYLERTANAFITSNIRQVVNIPNSRQE